MIVPLHHHDTCFDNRYTNDPLPRCVNSLYSSGWQLRSAKVCATQPSRNKSGLMRQWLHDVEDDANERTSLSGGDHLARGKASWQACTGTTPDGVTVIWFRRISGVPNMTDVIIGSPEVLAV